MFYVPILFKDEKRTNPFDSKSSDVAGIIKKTTRHRQMAFSDMGRLRISNVDIVEWKLSLGNEINISMTYFAKIIA